VMNCEQVTRFAGDVLGRKLSIRDRMAFAMHIAMCRGCRVFLEQNRLTILGLRSLKPPFGEGAGVDALLDRFRDETRRRDG